MQDLEPAPNCSTKSAIFELQFGRESDTYGKHIVLHRAQLRLIDEPTLRPELLYVFAPDGFVVVNYPGVDADYAL
jgi:hypothetical protein